MKHHFDIDQFLYTFFNANECDILSREKGVIKVKLTEEIDQAIMNRPFYWHYMNKTGQKGDPYELTLITDRTKQIEQGEWIHIGTPRMNDIFRYMKKKCTFIKLYEQIDAGRQTMLQPWLIINISLAFKGKQLKEELLSIGINLINGAFLENAMEQLKDVSLDSFIGDNCYKISPIISIMSGFRRIERRVHESLQQYNYKWVLESINELKNELILLGHFYDKSEDVNNMKKEAMGIIHRFQPEIRFQIINGGLFYLSEQWNKISFK